MLGGMPLVLFFLIVKDHKSASLSHINIRRVIIVDTFVGCTLNTFVIPLIDDAHVLIVTVRMQCLAASLMLELHCLVSIKKYTSHPLNLKLLGQLLEVGKNQAYLEPTWCLRIPFPLLTSCF
jgi:hypothetical protein